MWAPGKVAGDQMPLPQPPQGVDLRLSLGSFSFTFLLAGVGTPRLESTREKPGETPADSLLVPRLLTLAAALRPAPFSQSLMEVQNGRW